MSTNDVAAVAPAALALHRIRYLDWSPSTITSLAVSPVYRAASASSSASSSRGILAIGRQNGDIELCVWLENRAAHKAEVLHRSFHTYAKGWIVHTLLPGQLNSKIEQLAFANPPVEGDNGVHKLRLFSISGGAIVTEHFLPADIAILGAKSNNGSRSNTSSGNLGGLSTLFPGRADKSSADQHVPGAIRTVPSLGGAVWSMAVSPTGRYLAIGCEDGHARIIDLVDNKFEHLASSSNRGADVSARLGKAQGRIISLAWGPPKRASRAATTANGGSAQSKQQKEGDSSDSDSDSDSSDSDSDDDDDDDAAESGWKETFLVGGLGNSSAAVWDVASGRIASKLTVQKARSEATIVWCVATLPDGTIVTGDSTGRVTLFDAKTRVPIPGATFRSHTSGADVLSLCVGPDGKSLYSAGVDQKVAEYALVASASSKRGRWVQIAARRLHAHDIRSLAIDPPYDPMLSVDALAQGVGTAVGKLPILLSGGVDFNLILTPASPPSGLTMALAAGAAAGLPNSNKRKKNPLMSAAEQEQALINPISSNAVTTFADSTQRRIPFVPSTARSGSVGGGSVATVCRGKGWIVLRREHSIGIWDLGIKDENHGGLNELGEEASAVPPQWTKLLEMELKVNSNLCSVAVSPNGKFLAASDMYETKLFALRERISQQHQTDLEPRKVKSFASVFGHDDDVAPGASALSFSPDSSRLVLASWSGSYVHVVELPSAEAGASAGTCRLLRSFGQHRQRPGSASVGDVGASSNNPQGRQLAGRNGVAASKQNGSNGQGHGNGSGSGSGDDAGHPARADDETGRRNSARGGQSDRVERSTSSLIHHVQISSDGAWLSTISSDLQHHVFSLDSLTFERTLPSPHALPSGSSFHPSTHAARSSMLTLVFSDNKIEFWDVESGKELSSIAHLDTASSGDGSLGGSSGEKRKAGGGALAKRAGQGPRAEWEAQMANLKLRVQERLMSIRESAIGAVWVGKPDDGGIKETLVVWGPTWICTARHDAQSTTSPAAPAAASNGGSASVSRPAAAQDGDGDVEMADLPGSTSGAVSGTGPAAATAAAGVPGAGPGRGGGWHIKHTHKYQPLLLVDSIATGRGQVKKDDLVVVERPFYELARNLPPAFHRGARYGA
ncbi:uncharacterized protein PFL1_00619 [Pseudozyma flocculosa PF-1]|uniref:Related to UTP4 - U3 snoRNP protein n=1 Tax=Pseudozyma flocculosa TaxID=84751 RepID=A0A5C3EQL2_9BASI|nr:uncharacterized protein PFL1_00619 [Pseudozyma flocculosa PF-1]EPQ32423.1 hypothetical protein PFL1_00619 [Pseudozyma flocculosa PF-1]SPO34593.1 related to UTP4 - U3 snoRNP protein [Pseudozyma flocculosa]